MKIKVIKVSKNGKIGYLKSPTIFGGLSMTSSEPIVDNPTQAKNYALPEFEKDLKTDISYLKLPNKPTAAMSGVSVDTAHIVEIELSLTEISIQEAYIPEQNSNKLKP